MSLGTDDQFRQKFAALNESSDSIQHIAAYIIFYKSKADHIARLWLEMLQGRDVTPPKRLNMLYVANEVVQQTKAKRKDHWEAAFQPIIFDGFMTAYKGAPVEIQTKLRRVLDVWQQRGVFDQVTRDQLDKEVPRTSGHQCELQYDPDLRAEVDRNRQPAARKQLGGSLDSSQASIPTELKPLVQSQQGLSKAFSGIKASLDPANKDYDALTSSEARPSPPLLAARLNQIGKSLAAAEAAVAETLKHRNALIAGLEKLLQSNRTAAENEEKQQAQINSRRREVEAQRRDVEDAIMRGLPAADVMNHHIDPLTSGERPEIERFTPPPPSPEPAHAELHAMARAERSTTPTGLPPATKVERSTTPPGLPPPVAHQTNGHQADTTPTTLPEVNPQQDYSDPYESVNQGTLTPPAAPAPEASTFEPDYEPPVNFNPAPTAPPASSLPGLGSSSASTLPGLGASTPTQPTTNGTLDPRKRPASAVNAAADPRRRRPMSGGASASPPPQKRRKASEDEFAALDVEGLGVDKEVLGMLG